MSIIISGHHFTETPALKAHTNEKLSKLFRHYGHIIKIECEMNSEVSHRGKENDFYVLLNIQIPGKTIRIEDNQRDMYTAVDRAIERADATLRKAKEKEIAKRRKV
ncbi:MAG TPA: ribosome-associated translation inhibitor RaiA [Patescibacteria group bacterium]